jgi:hypothetical protein
MATYTRQGKLSTYNVDVRFIAKVEEYLLSEVCQIISGEKEAGEKLLQLIIHDSHGEEKLNGIAEYKFPLFRDDIDGITINYTYSHGSNKIEMVIRFGLVEKNTDISIVLEAEQAREKVVAIETGLQNAIFYNKNLNRVLYSIDSYNGLWFILSMAAALLLVAEDTFVSRSSFYKLICWLVIILTAFILISTNFFKSYSSFDTNKQKRLDKIYNWFFLGALSFILITSTLTSVRRAIFGF